MAGSRPAPRHTQQEKEMEAARKYADECNEANETEKGE